MSTFKITKITGKLTLESGLHIGSGDTEMHIGGVDNQVIKDPITGEPYIPGSSLKGKIRSLLEYYAGSHVKTDGRPLSASKASTDLEKHIVTLFGSSGSDDRNAEFGVSRLVFSDTYLNKESRQSIMQTYGKFTEVKAENSINRLKGTAENPRFTERVIKGAVFDFAVSMRIFPKDNYDQLMEVFLTGLKLLTFDALGGSGSRGYGKVSIKFDKEDLQEKFDKITF
ncbi:type III-A CRISPR-associated RAMP protein Csm3 [Calditerrivibrio nitroreducens]|uniref:CRISPR system Cms endoribonuclease Csm3 n=1 Tax=Calditerrivibrio nitroreducens (strain DSM 19672 / NBRC 101217 / Yu37-1) TaxID=768670 RepID=E4TFE6_CALNY|nr:type III-A CRISPR-associated RAMP protein Csm3 [Calditerrivibrio nitroreducens]ADR19519.1 CRISPR-associated protein, Csm3 family [Calditerrivibrio nitroreducens DSM 19672]